ncbi:MAG: DUF3810 domain-containing protein [Nonlabens sp.]
MRQTRRLILALGLFIVQIVTYYLLRFFPAFVETFYSTGIYPYLSSASRWVTGWIPFSLGDLVYAGVIILALRWLWRSKMELISLSRKRYTQLFTTLNIVLFFFHAAWGFNYYRQPLHKSLELKADYTTQELAQTIRYFKDESNKLHSKLQPVDSLPVPFTESQKDLFKAAPSGYENLSKEYPHLDYNNLSAKKSLLTLPLSYMGYSGYLNPFTGEAQTNAYINNYKTPVLTLHEMAHQLGYAKENEANFIAILAGTAHNDPFFKYSASIFALRYCLNDLYRRDPELYKTISEGVRPGIYANYQELRDFWKSYEGSIVEEVSQATYNTYLKANNQPGGMETYSYVVALLVNYYSSSNNSAP